MSARAAQEEARYAVGAVVRLTGLSEHVIRAWERRYAAVVPSRTPGGSRRYSDADVARLRLLRAGVQAGHPISELAPLPDHEIERRLSALVAVAENPLELLLQAVETLDVGELERLLGMHLSSLGPAAFAREVASPLLREIGDRWESGELPVAAEHAASAVTRGILGVALRGTRRGEGPRAVFSTPSGERHEFGVLIAAVCALGQGVDAIYLGPDMPVGELADAARRLEARAVGLSLVSLGNDESQRYIEDLARQLPEDAEIWIGGPARFNGIPKAISMADLDEMATHIQSLKRLPR